jgi:hypothetical protein
MVHVSRPLTNISVAHVQSADAFVASRVFPIIPVSKQADQYFRYNRGDFNRDEMRKRAPGTESAGGGYKLDTDTYFADVWGFHKDIDDQTRANYDDPLNPDSEATIYVTQKALINREAQFATKFFVPTKWGKDVDGLAANPVVGTSILHWTNASSTPILDVAYYQTYMLQRTGFEPNVLVLGKLAWDALRNHPEILDRISYGGTPNTPAKITKQAVAALFEVDEILVMKAIKTTDATDESLAGSFTDTQEFIGSSKAALLCYRPPAAGLMTPASGYTFAWNGLLGASTFGTRITTLRMDHLKSDRVEIESAYAQKMVGSDLGVFFTDVAP